jgi:hypothetical protein
MSEPYEQAAAAATIAEQIQKIDDIEQDLVDTAIAVTANEGDESVLQNAQIMEEAIEQSIPDVPATTHVSVGEQESEMTGPLETSTSGIEVTLPLAANDDSTIEVPAQAQQLSSDSNVPLDIPVQKDLAEKLVPRAVEQINTDTIAPPTSAESSAMSIDAPSRMPSPLAPPVAKVEPTLQVPTVPVPEKVLPEGLNGDSATVVGNSDLITAWRAGR